MNGFDKVSARVSIVHHKPIVWISLVGTNEQKSKAKQDKVTMCMRSSSTKILIGTPYLLSWTAIEEFYKVWGKRIWKENWFEILGVGVRDWERGRRYSYEGPY